jgi:hypothetical protein
MRRPWLWGSAIALLGAAALASEPTPGDAKPMLLVSDLAAQDVSPGEAAAMTDAVVESLSGRGLFRVLTSRDVETILNAERRRELLGGCAADRSDCAASVGSALGARFVTTGSLSRLGSTFQLSLQTLDTAKGQPVGRGTRLARDLTTLRLLVPYVAAEATGSPLPPPPSRALQYGMVAAGSGALIGGAVLGMLALGAQTTLNNELCPGGPAASPAQGCTGTNLRPRAFYLAQDQSLGQQKTAGLLLMIGGAALAGAGVYLMPPAEGGARVAVVPSPSGVALVGAFP